MALLSGKYELLGIEDVEAFTASVVHRSRLDLSHHDREELHVFLIEQCWKLSLRYKPGIIQQGFSTYARITLSRRVIDWLRQRRFDYRYERGIELVPLDSDDPEHANRLGAALSAGSVDSGAYRLADELRGLEARAPRPGGRDDYLDRPPPG